MRTRKLFAILVAMAATFAVAQTSPPDSTLSKDVREEVLKEVTRIVTNVAFVPGVEFKKFPEFMESQKETLDKAANPRELTVAVNASLRKFGISHIVMATPEAATARRTRSAIGIGVQIQIDPKGVRVTNVFPGSPADQAGIQPGDLITEHNGKKVETPADMQGDEGSTAQLKVERDDKIKTFKVVRKKYSNVRPETLAWPTPDTAVLKVWTFDTGYDQKNVEKLLGQASKARNLILDLRSNGGGAVTNLIHLMNLLLPEKTSLGTFIQRGMVDRYVKETGGSPTNLAAIASFIDRPIRVGKGTAEKYKGNIAVLINGGSGSASEIAAAALQEALGAPVIGGKSAGAVLVSIMGPLPHGYMLQYPVTDFVTSKGIRLEGNGVEPILEAAQLVRWGEKDSAIDKAVLLLQRIDLRQDRNGSGQ